MNLPGTDVTSVRSDLDKIVQLDDSGNIDSNGSAFLNSIHNRLSLIQSTLPVIQESIRNLETRINKLLPITLLFTWANDGQVDIVNLQEEYTQTFKSNNQDKTLTFGTSSFNVSIDSLNIQNHDTSILLLWQHSMILF